MGNAETNMGSIQMGLMMWPEFNELVEQHQMNRYDKYMSTFVDIVYTMETSGLSRPLRGTSFVDTPELTKRSAPLSGRLSMPRSPCGLKTIS